ncbi:MAG: serine/threonine-protein phosphatase [Actinomycetota bacterium]|nr:serine/threonine-protein phosphatase [Actinomycetota bacterium]
MGHREDVWTAVAAGVFAIVALLDSVLAGPGFDALLVAGAVIASATLSTRRTLALATAAVVGAIAIGGLHDRLVMASGGVRVVGIAAVGAFCVLASHWREHREKVLQRVTRVAEVAQLAILRPIPTRVATVNFASRYISAADQAFIGGDLYEVVPATTGVRVVVGDVRGKGLDAVRLAALVLGSFREAANVEDALAHVAMAVDRAVLGDISLEDFVTAVFVEFRPGGDIEVVNCGHHSPLRVSSRVVEYLHPAEASPPLGLSPAFTAQVHHLERGDRLLLYTDGLVEARAPDRTFFKMVPDTLSTLRRRSLDSALEGLVNEVLRHAGGHLDDDLALLLAEVRA